MIRELKNEGQLHVHKDCNYVRTRVNVIGKEDA